MRTTIIALIAIIVVLLLLLWYHNRPTPEPVIDRQATWDSLKVFKDKSMALQKSKDSAIALLVVEREKNDASESRYVKKIRTLEHKALVARTPQVDSLLASNQELNEYVSSLDTIIVTMAHRIDSLGIQARIERQMHDDIVEKSDSLLLTEKQKSDYLLDELGKADASIASLEKKLKRQKKLKWLFGAIGAASRFLRFGKS